MSNQQDETALREAELLARAREGDRGALEDLLVMHQDRVYRTALGFLGGDEEAASEVAQDVLISMARSLASFRGDSKLTTWLYRMTINYAKNHLAAKSRRAARFVSLDAPSPGDDEGDGLRHDAPHEAPHPRERASGAELQAILHARLQLLQEEFRAVMILRFVEDRPYEEIADMLGVPVGTVKSRINRGRAELRRLMADVLPGAGIP